MLQYYKIIMQLVVFCPCIQNTFINTKAEVCSLQKLGIVCICKWGFSMTSTGGESEIYSQRGRQNLVHYSKGNSTNIANTILKYLGEVDNIVKVENPWIANLWIMWMATWPKSKCTQDWRKLSHLVHKHVFIGGKNVTNANKTILCDTDDALPILLL